MPADPAASGEGATGGVPTPAAPAPSSGGAPEGYVSRAELDAVEARRRSFQAERDRLAAENEQLKAAHAAPAAPAPVAAQPQGGITFEQMRAELARVDAMRDARARVSQDFAMARPEVLSGSYATPEEFVLAASRSHEAEKTYREQVRVEQEAAVKAELAKNPVFAKAFTPAPQTPPAGGEGGPAGMTREEWLAKPFSERMAVPDDVLQKALAQ